MANRIPSPSRPSPPHAAAPAAPLAAAPTPPPAPVWSVRLLGAVELCARDGRPARLPSRAATQLLARLALAPDRMHPREELIELLWPGVALDVGRNRLRQVLSTLKSLLEAGREAPVILADRLGLRAAPGALACDAVDFERHLRSGDWDRADQAYRGELLPGHYDEWVLDERNRLATLAERLESMPRVAPTRPAARAEAPPVRPGQLPSFWTRLFGTEIHATRLRELVRHQRLVTVFGAGGSGKTRLAVEAARALAEPTAWAPGGQDEPPPFGQVAFVSLVDCTDAARAVDAIAGALQVQGREPLAGVARALAGQRTLLVLDNYEQLAGQAEAVVQQLLTDSAGLHLLITSRQRLGLPGEQVFELAGLPLPETARSRSGDEALSGQAAVALFIDRARAVAPDFAVGAAQEAAIVELVRLLAGMPLAIELAASRMRSLSPQALLALLTDGRTPMLDLLARDPAGHSMAQRHASMRHVVAWSWQQLSAPLEQVMQALSAFAAPALAETVAAVAGLDLRAARERLEQLRDHSLVVGRRDASGTQRYVLLQPVREFVVENAPPAQVAAGRDRLRRWLIDFGHRQASRGLACLDEVEAELPQVYAAILGAEADGPEAGVQAVAIVVALRRHWEVDTRAGLPLAVLKALQTALHAVHDPRMKCEASVLLAFSCVLAGFTAEALALAHQAVALAPDPRLRAHALVRESHVMMFSGQDTSKLDGTLDEAVTLARRSGDLEMEALALRAQFLVAVNRDDDRVRGEALAMQGQALWERLGHRRNAYSGLMDRASCWLSAGRLDEAATALAACEQAALQERHATGHIMSSWQLGRALLKLRRADAALAAYRRCLQGAWEHKRMAYVADALVQLPGGLAFSGQEEDAARLLGFAAAHWQQQFGNFYRELERDVCIVRRWLRGRLGVVRFESLRLEGACLGLAEAVALGLGRAA